MTTPAQEISRDRWRRGDSDGHKRAALNAKATLAYIREHPGSTRAQIVAALGVCNIPILKRHGLIYWQRIGDCYHWHAVENPKL